jgi:hypothetical protein
VASGPLAADGDGDRLQDPAYGVETIPETVLGVVQNHITDL